MTTPDLRAQLSAALRAALTARDARAASALRSALAAIGNAEAVSADAVPVARTSSQHFAAASAGPGAADVPRRVLTEEAVANIVRAEVAERQLAADHYAAGGHADRAERLRAEARVIEALLAGTSTAT